MDADLDIRLMADDPEQIGAVARWIYNEWGHCRPGRTLATAHEKARQALGGADVPLTLVARKNGMLVGTASIDTRDMSTHPELTPWMASVVVEKAWRGRGIGSALCRRIEVEMRRLGIKTAYLFTPDQEDLYVRLGWKTFLHEDYRGETVAIMRLDLD
jgi:predicted N-acetyltransferase YhbS